MVVGQVSQTTIDALEAAREVYAWITAERVSWLLTAIGRVLLTSGGGNVEELHFLGMRLEFWWSTVCYLRE